MMKPELVARETTQVERYTTGEGCKMNGMKFSIVGAGSSYTPELLEEMAMRRERLAGEYRNNCAACIAHNMEDGTLANCMEATAIQLGAELPHRFPDTEVLADYDQMSRCYEPGGILRTTRRWWSSPGLP